MKSIQTKFITLILGCVLLSSLVIGGAGIMNANQVVDKDSAYIMNLMCSEKANELNGLFSAVSQYSSGLRQPGTEGCQKV